LTREPQKIVTELAGQRLALAEASRRNAEALQAMGMAPRVAARWSELNDKFLATYQRTSDVSGGFGAMSKVMRMLLQSLVLGVGAYLVIIQEATAGWFSLIGKAKYIHTLDWPRDHFCRSTMAPCRSWPTR
jgi:ATP-binding cassette subfamily C protein